MHTLPSGVGRDGSFRAGSERVQPSNGFTSSQLQAQGLPQGERAYDIDMAKL